MTTTITPTIIWRYEDQYVDFTIDGINGVFRATDSKGVNVDRVINHIQANADLFKKFAVKGTEIFREAETSSNWGNGWEWQETKHPTQAEGYCLDPATAWFTCPFGSKEPEIQGMDKLHRIESDGVKLLYSYDSNRQPGVICYFFPDKQLAIS